jgi:hypothetical protein
LELIPASSHGQVGSKGIAVLWPTASLGGKRMAMTLVAVVKRQNLADLKCGESADDPEPFILTLTPQYVAHQTFKLLPL